MTNVCSVTYGVLLPSHFPSTAANGNCILILRLLITTDGC